MAVRTWAPRGQTPVLRVPLTRDHLIFHQWHHPRWATVPTSAPGFLRCGSGGRLSARALAQDQGADPAHLGRLTHPSRARDQRLSQAWGGQALTSGTTAGLCPGSQPRRRHLELPRNLVELGNVCCRDLQHLSTELIRARERLRHKREVIRSCSQQCGYSV
jgi:hypothetical protein